MVKEKSCGCIIIENDKVLLIRQLEGHWGFPKGHVEPNETELETAIREVKEETNIDVEITSSKKYTMEYFTPKNNLKEVVFFLAKQIGGNFHIQEEEIQDIGWFNFDDAFNIITHDNTKALFREVLNDINY